jgi:hypothetical protein
VADERDLERELPRTDPSLVAWALADRLEAELEPVSRGVRGAAARAKFLRVFRGLLRLHLRRTSSRAALRAELGLATDNALEAAQCLARGRMERHLLRLLEVTSDADRRAELQELLRVTRRLRLR